MHVAARTDGFAESRTGSSRVGVTTLASSLLLLALGLPGGCRGVRPYRAAIQSDTPHERILGIRDAARAKDEKAVPLLVDRLEDEDQAVRFYAILALEQITGQRLGYNYARPAHERAGSVERWRAYVRHGRTDTTASAEGPPPDVDAAPGRLTSPAGIASQ